MEFSSVRNFTVYKKKGLYFIHGHEEEYCGVIAYKKSVSVTEWESGSEQTFTVNSRP